MTDPTRLDDPVRLLERATPDHVRDLDYHELVGRRRRRRRLQVRAGITAVLAVAVLAVVWVGRLATPDRVDVLSIRLDDLPGPDAPGWPIEVFHRIESRGTPALTGPLDQYTTRFEAQSWATWTYGAVGSAVMDGSTIPAEESATCSARIEGRPASCDGEVEPDPDPDQVGPMGPSGLVRPLAGVVPDSVDYHRSTLAMADGSTRAVIEATKAVVYERCAQTGYDCTDPDARSVETTRIVADETTWVPLVYDVDVDDIPVIRLRATAINGVDVRD